MVATTGVTWATKTAITTAAVSRRAPGVSGPRTAANAAVRSSTTNAPMYRYSMWIATYMPSGAPASARANSGHRQALTCRRPATARTARPSRPGGLADAQPSHARAQHRDPRQRDDREAGERDRPAARHADPAQAHDGQQRERDDGDRQHRELGEVAHTEHESQTDERRDRRASGADAGQQRGGQQHGAEHEEVGRDQTQRDHPEAGGQEHRVGPQAPRPVGGNSTRRRAADSIA